jgi:transcriptional regulator with XRE-family HTH domain
VLTPVSLRRGSFVDVADGSFCLAFRQRLAARKGAGLTQRQLADRLGVSQQIIASYGAGRRRTLVSLLPRLARALGVTIEALVGEDS